MIAKWLYEITCGIGGALNNGIGIQRSPQSDALSGVLFLWLMFLLVALIAVCFAILYALERKEKKK